jgi:uncharacterized protein YbcI
MGISNAIVHLYKEHLGRGPTKTCTRWSGTNVIVVILEETLTTAERALADLGEHERIRLGRAIIHDTHAHEYCEPVELFTGRRVRTHVCGIDTALGGMAVETFVLHPVSA